MNAFFDSQFSYCPLICMCHSKKLHNKINWLHEKCLCIIYDDKTSSYEELVFKDGSVSMHHKNLQKLVIEIYKVLKKQSRNGYHESVNVSFVELS